jgi:iron-sulfur cluster assembly protein
MSQLAEPNVETSMGNTILLVTEAAAVKSRLALEGSGNQGIRVAVTGGGCAGLQYDLKPDVEPLENDIVLEFFGVKFFINPMVVPYIKGTTLDFSNQLMDGGFKFVNPNAASSCGCGSSFGV